MNNTNIIDYELNTGDVQFQVVGLGGSSPTSPSLYQSHFSGFVAPDICFVTQFMLCLGQMLCSATVMGLSLLIISVYK